MTMQEFYDQYGVTKNDVFQLVLGQENDILPGRGFGGYMVVVGDEEMICFNDKLSEKEYRIPYAAFQKAEFGIGSGNLWLQCMVNGHFFVFCTTRGGWKSQQGKRLLEKIGAVTPIEDMKSYEQFTGKFFWFWALVK